MNKSAFTLAEVLITLAIIGVVAAISIPSVISNTQQKEFKVGLKKAISVLNSAITINMALDGESPYDNKDLFGYLTRHMSVVRSGRTAYPAQFLHLNGNKTNYSNNVSFYTSDGIKFEAPFDVGQSRHLKLHESDNFACLYNATTAGGHQCGGCGSYGLKHNPNNTTKSPCAILVDVNGDRKPNPANVNAKYTPEIQPNVYKAVSPESKLVSDIFTILITEDRAIPYGVVAQKAMYEAQKY